MTTLARTDRSVLGRWWWTVDRWTLAAVALLLLAGLVLIMAASPPVADRLGADPFHFSRRQAVFLAPAAILLVATSLLTPRGVRLSALAVLVLTIALLAATLVVGSEIKGARRWISLGGFSLQAAEFAKPAFAVVGAWLLTQSKRKPGFPGFAMSAALLALLSVLLTFQPDIGMVAMLSTVWGGQLFLAGLPLVVLLGLAAMAVAGAFLIYAFLPHVSQRIDSFIDPSSNNSYQIDTAIRAFETGGLLGRGPGEGVVKDVLPDAHSDLIFAVAGEEFGLVTCLVLLALFAFVSLRGLARMRRQRDLYVMLAVTGLLIQFAAQAIINMGVSLRLLPPTGMTLPFVSYGGSSLIAMAYAVGMVLALTRRRPEYGRWA